MALTLAHLEHRPEGAETQPPLLIAHGLYGAARNFNAIAKRLATDRRVVCVDMRNHGASPWDATMTYPAMAEDLAEAVDRLAGGRAAVLGHSMGGKAAMALALTAPERVAALVVADIAPVAYAHSHRGYLEAMAAVDLSRVARRSDAEPQLAEAVPEAPLRAFLLQNLIVDAAGARWRINIPALDQGMAALTGFPDLSGRSYPGPTLFLHGTASDYVTEAARPAIGARFPAAEIQGLAGAGHWLHAEQPEPFRAAVAAWLAGQIVGK